MYMYQMQIMHTLFCDGCEASTNSKPPPCGMLVPRLLPSMSSHEEDKVIAAGKAAPAQSGAWNASG